MFSAGADTISEFDRGLGVMRTSLRDAGADLPLAFGVDRHQSQHQRLGFLRGGAAPPPPGAGA